MQQNSDSISLLVHLSVNDHISQVQALEDSFRETNREVVSIQQGSAHLAGHFFGSLVHSIGSHKYRLVFVCGINWVSASRR